MSHDQIRRYTAEVLQRGGLQTGLPKVMLDASQVQHLLDTRDAFEQRIAELEAEVAHHKKWARLNANAGLDVQKEYMDECVRLRTLLERVRWVLDEIVSAYRAYRACGVIPAPDPYQRLVEAIKCADELAAALKEGATDEPRTRPIQGGYLEKDTLTGEVHEPLLQDRPERT